MRAFILRRVELIARGLGDVVLIGSTHSAGTLRVKEFLTRNGHPYTYVDLDRDRRTCRRCSIASTSTSADVPVADLPRRRRAAEPDQRARSPTASASTKRSTRRTSATWSIVGAGPAGLAAAVYGASEGLDVLVVESHVAGRPGRLELAHRELPGLSRPASPGRSWPAAPTRRRRSSAPQVLIAKGATQLACSRKPYAIAGRRRAARAGARRDHRDRRRVSQARRSTTWRSSRAPGVYYGATFVEAQLCDGEEVIVVGGGNSAGQAAVFLSQYRAARARAGAVRRARRQHVALPDSPHRGEPEHRAAHADGDRRRSKATTTSSGSRWRSDATGAVETRAIRHVFVMTGAMPNTGWLDGCVALDAKGFIKTGPDLSRRGSGDGAVAARAAAAPARDEPAGRVRGRRRARRQHEARRVGGRRGIDRRRLRASGAEGVGWCD